MAEHGLIIEQPALAMSIQGRPFRGSRHYGVPLAGPADPIACALANWLAGNGGDAPALEWAMSAFAASATSDMMLGVAGAVGAVSINGQQHDPQHSLMLNAGDHIRITPAPHGCRLYLAVQKGFAVDPMLGATSSYAPAKLGHAVEWSMNQGDTLPARLSGKTVKPRQLPHQCRQTFSDSHILRYIPAGDSLPDGQWRASQRLDRSAIQLEAISNEYKPSEFASTVASNAVFPGTIQLPPDGRPLLMGVDARTTGGYHQAGQVIRADRHLLGQIRAGDTVQLITTNIKNANAIYRQKLSLWRRYLPDLKLD